MCRGRSGRSAWKCFFLRGQSTRQLYAESLTAQHSGIVNNVLLFSEVGPSLVHHYRIHRMGRHHAMFRGKYLAQLRALLPVNTIMPTVGGPSGPACSPVPSTAGRKDGLGAMPRPPGYEDLYRWRRALPACPAATASRMGFSFRLPQCWGVPIKQLWVFPYLLLV